MEDEAAEGEKRFLAWLGMTDSRFWRLNWRPLILPSRMPVKLKANTAGA